MPGKILKKLIQQDLESNLVSDVPAFTKTKPNLTFQHCLFVEVFFMIASILINNNILSWEEKFA